VQMIDLLNKYKNDDDLCQNDGKLIIDCNINRSNNNRFCLRSVEN